MRTFTSLASLKGRVALIMGGASPAGRAIAETYAELGAAIALLDRPGAGTEHVARALTDTYGILTTVLTVDLTDEAALRKAPQRVVDACGRLDILVVTTPVPESPSPDSPGAALEAQGLPAWRTGLDTQLTAPFIVIQQAVPALRASGKGSIVIVGGLPGVLGPDRRTFEETDFSATAVEAVAGGGLVQMMRWLATTVAPEVRANAIIMGHQERPSATAVRRRTAARTPLARIAIDEDIKGVAAFLASDLSAFMTGQCLTVDGGWSSW